MLSGLSTVRHIASSFGADDLFLTAEFERRVRVWSLVERRLLGEFDTVLDYGGRRLALCGTLQRPIVVAGAYQQHGICGYDGLSGTQLWQRKDLKKIQTVVPLEGGSLLCACFDERPLHALDAMSGETVVQIRCLREIYPSPLGSLAITWRHGKVGNDGVVGLLDTAEWNHTWHAGVDGQLLAAAFSPDAVVVSRGGGDGANSFYCFDLAGKLLWQLRLPPETNAWTVAWDAMAAEWIAVRHHYNLERPDTLVRISVDGAVLTETPLGLLGDFKLLPSGRHLVTGLGQVLDTQSGSSVWDFG